MRPDVSGQAKAGQGFDIAAFVIDWEAKKVTGPTGQIRVDWTPTRDPWGNDTIHVGFHRPTGAAGSRRPLCTRARAGPREITLRPRPLHEALQNVRGQQETEAWRARYGPRAGVEGTLSQAVRAFGLRRCRSIGLAKTQLQQVFTVIAVNVARVDAWLTERPWAKTRRSAFASLAPPAGAA